MMWIGKYSTGAIVLALMSTAALTTARADLVFDDEASEAPADSKAQERDQLRKVYKTTQQVETSNELSVSTEPVVAEAAEAPTLSRSELLRRKRIREEMKNEDLLTQRLEELRLREETRRTKKLLKTSGLDEEDEERAESRSESASTRMSPAPVMQETTVAAPITEKPGSEPSSLQMTPAPQIQVTQVQPAAMTTDHMAYSSSSATMSSTMETSRMGGEGRITVTPRLGFASISNDYYDFNSKYAAGMGVGFGVSDHLSVELGYTYSQSSIQMPNYGNPFQELNYNQNLFDIAMKLGFVGPEAKVRPYVMGGAGYSMGYINYDQRTQDMIRYQYPYMDVKDYQLNQIVGTLGGGLEFMVGKNASIGVGYKLVAPLSSSEDQPLWNYAFGNVDPVKDQVRGSLRDSSTHMFLVSGGFSF